MDDPQAALDAFLDSARREASDDSSALTKWLHTDRKLAGGQLEEMRFYEFVGAGHLRRFFRYIRRFKYPDYFDETVIAPLAALSSANDARVFEKLGLRFDQGVGDKIGRYNAQDYLFQRAYPTPDRQAIRRVLDFGAGHGRMANLAFSAPGSQVSKYFAVDGIPASYLTQRMYYETLGLRVHDFLDHSKEQFDIARVEDDFDVFHFPTWRFADLPTGYFDIITCVQVLRELSREVLFHILPHFTRVLKPGGALYIRDHLLTHNPSGLPQDEILEAHGFLIEFQPRIRDKVDSHGVPRIWRKVDPMSYALPK